MLELKRIIAKTMTVSLSFRDLQQDVDTLLQLQKN